MTQNTREWEQKFDVIDWLRNSYGLDDDDCLSAGQVQELCESLVYDLTTLHRPQLQKAGEEKFVDGLIAATQWLIDNGHLKAGKELNEMMIKALVPHSELDQDRTDYPPNT